MLNKYLKNNISRGPNESRDKDSLSTKRIPSLQSANGLPAGRMSGLRSG